MDGSWLEHVLSVAFGGAGGLLAGVARLTASLATINKNQTEFQVKLDSLERKAESHFKQLSECTQQLDAQRRQHDQQLDELRRSTVAQSELSHRLIADKIDEVRTELHDTRSSFLGQATDLQRSVGGLEGTLKMIARNGCARACASDRGSVPDFPSEPPTTRGRGTR